MQSVYQLDGFLSLSRRGLEPPDYLIARSSRWDTQPSPWRDRDRLPRLHGGVLGELLYGNEPRLFDDLQVDRDDPAFEYLEGMRSLLAIPVYDQGQAMNLVVQMRRSARAFDPELFPQAVWLTNLFSRATHNLVVSEQLREANEKLDREAATIAEIQRSLLPRSPERTDTLDIAVHYQAAGRAGGDYYDFFPLPDGGHGFLLADVSGHGTPAAVLMSITHAIAHLYQGPPGEPSRMLQHLNEQLVARYTSDSGSFVTALYGVYEPGSHRFTYSLAGHPPPRVRHCDDKTIERLPNARNPPLGVMEGVEFDHETLVLRPGDQVLFFTDGLTEARNPQREFFGMERIDRLLATCHLDADGLIRAILGELQRFTGSATLEDDLTLIVARVT